MGRIATEIADSHRLLCIRQPPRDAVKAQDLYAKADAAGTKEAKARIEALRR
ncbi:hypothetical protein V1274_004520 [Bradyrhizobium sp. AZCC 1614]|uniref:hypothetical protein n=1 Tax=Bradyrhizobium sp. AZCC 1614 TaxID=3117017 RepID=UPI002FEFBEED